MDLTIAIVSYNCRDYLRACLASLPAEIGEVSVVDNASSDGAAEMVEAEFPAVALIANRENRGFAAACNQALRSARGRYLLLLNPDTTVSPGALQEMLSFLDSHPRAAAAACRLANPDGTLQPSVRAFPTPAAVLGMFTVLGCLGFFRSAVRRYRQTDFDYGRESRIEQPMGAALFLRREAWEKAGGMDEGYFLYLEEVDLCRRLFDAGGEIWYNPRCNILHAGGRSTGPAGAWPVFHLLRGYIRYFRKFRPGAATSCFIAVFKPLYLLGTVGGTIEAGGALAGRSFFGAPAEKVEKARRRFQRKRAFLKSYALEFLFRA
jgi:hypothetical protein